jgi:hypothetical protein
MKLVSLLLVITCLGATDIHKHGMVMPRDVFPVDNATIISFSNGIEFDTRNGERILHCSDDWSYLRCLD